MSSFENYREQIRAAVRPVDLLCRKDIAVGRDHKAPCPFHQDGGTPNLHVYHDHVYCFSCRTYADVFEIVERLDRVSHREAVDRLGHDARIAPWNPSPEEVERAQRADRATSMLDAAAKFYAANLTDEHRAYLHDRGLADEEIVAVGFGTSNGGLVAHLRTLGFDLDDMCVPPDATEPDKWLAKRSDSGVVADFFWAGLIVIPIRHRGRVTGFTARNLNGAPKFLHLPGKRIPFGLDSLNGSEAVVVEGPFDALAVNRHGYPAVALLGTALDESLCERLQRLKSVHVALDGDAAGRRSAVDVAAAIGKRARIVRLAEGKDPDQVTKEEFDAALATGRDVVGHKLLDLKPDMAPMELTSWIEDSGLIRDLAAEDELRSDAHIQEIATALGFNKGKTKEFRALMRRTLGDERKKAIETKGAQPEIQAQFHKFDDGTGRLADVVLSHDGRATVWAIYDPGTGRVDLADKIPFKDRDLLPQTGPEVLGWNSVDPFHPDSGRAVLLHGPPIEYGTESALFAEVRAFIARYFTETDKNWLNLYVAYVFLSWAIEVASESPYLAWSGGAGSGKTRAMISVGVLCRRPMILSAGSSAAALRRTVDRWRGTVIADEGLLNDKTDAGQTVLAIILAGFSRLTAMMQVCEGENNEPRGYFVFGPKLFTGQIDFKDPGARSRTLTRTLSSDNRQPGQPVQLPGEFEAEAALLRRKLQLWRFRTLAADGCFGPEEGQTDGKEGKLLQGVPSRIQQVFLPLLRVLRDDAIRKELVAVARTHAADFATAKRQRIEGKMLQAVADLMGETGGRIARARPAERIHLKQIRDRVIAFEQAAGASPDEARRAVPQPTNLGRTLKGTLGLRTDADREGSHLVLETEQDLARLDGAMRNFGIQPPWPTHPPDCRGCEVCEVPWGASGQPGRDTTQTELDLPDGPRASPPGNLTNITPTVAGDGDRGRHTTRSRNPNRRESSGIHGPASGTNEDEETQRRSGSRSLVEPHRSDARVMDAGPEGFLPAEPHVEHHLDGPPIDRWDALCLAVDRMEGEGGITHPDCDTKLAAAVAACARDEGSA